MIGRTMIFAALVALAGCSEGGRERSQTGNPRPAESSPDGRGQNMGQAGRDEPGTSGLQRDQARTGSGPEVQGRRPAPGQGGASGTAPQGDPGGSGAAGSGGQAGSTGR